MSLEYVIEGDLCVSVYQRSEWRPIVAMWVYQGMSELEETASLEVITLRQLAQRINQNCFWVIEDSAGFDAGDPENLPRLPSGASPDWFGNSERSQ